jgi:phospholipid/cholesterol/gamma-HCH transport system permease protein
MSITLDEPSRIRRVLATIGAGTRRRGAFVLQFAALCWGVIAESVRPSSWRRTVRAEFWRALRQAAAGGLSATLFTAVLVGLVMVSQALYWLGGAGEEALLGSVLVTVLVREVTPLLIGLIVLGRSGTVAVAEIGALQLGGQAHALGALGVDAFAWLILPRAIALSLACFTLGTIFVVVALAIGFAVGSLLGAVHISLWLFFDDVLAAMKAADFAMFPAKMLTIGLSVAVVGCLTGLSAAPGERLADLLPRGFVRGVLVIMIISLVLSLAA